MHHFHKKAVVLPRKQEKPDFAGIRRNVLGRVTVFVEKHNICGLPPRHHLKIVALAQLEGVIFVGLVVAAVMHRVLAQRFQSRRQGVIERAVYKLTQTFLQLSRGRQVVLFCA